MENRSKALPEWLLPPNLITYARLVLAPLAAWAILAGRHQEALLLVVIAGASDGLDGFLARHFSWRSRLGSYLDPLADKLLLVLVFAALTLAGSMHWLVLALFAARDLWILSMVAYAWVVTPIRDYPPRPLGKVTTVSQIILAVTLLVNNAFPGQIPPWFPPSALAFACVCTLFSSLDYTIVAWRRYRAWTRSAIPGA